ncbi:MAG: AMP-binding protein [Patescibacteria group bacterium]|jgi:phenylacetate-coenzyme A ligase PaaK-like adenylate-forming protein
MDWNTISHLSRDEQRDLQNKRFAAYMKHQMPYSPYYRKLFEEHGLSFHDFKTTDDLVKIPFVTKEDIAPTEEDRAKSRKFILQPDEALIKKHASKRMLMKIIGMKLLRQDPKLMLEWQYKPIHLHFTTGRSALPTPFTYSSYDIELLKESGSRLMNVIGIDRNQVAINAFPYSPHLAFWLASFALQKIMMTSLHTGGGKIMGSTKILDATERMKASLITTIPGYFYHMLRQAKEEGRNFENLKYIVFGGERVSPGLKQKAREMLAEMGAMEPQFYTTYAMTEGKTAWIQCAENTGYHTYPDLDYWEVVDDEGKRVKEGEPGELVYTGLAWHGTTVLRYRTGDITKGISYDACPHCGKTVPRIHPDIQRKTEIREFNLTKVKGELVNLNAFYPILSGMKEIEEWQVQIRKKNNDPFEVDEIVVAVAMKGATPLNAIEETLKKQIVGEAGITPIIEEQDMDALLQSMGMETELKEKRIIDLRTQS